MKALNKDREQRHGSVLEFALEFAQAAPPLLRPLCGPNRSKKPSSRKRSPHKCIPQKQPLPTPWATRLPQSPSPNQLTPHDEHRSSPGFVGEEWGFSLQ